jgi:hypothetical protein
VRGELISGAIACFAIGCYAPVPEAGAPCAANGACPSGLLCHDGLCVGDLGMPIDASPLDDAMGDGPRPAPVVAFVQGRFATPQTPQSKVTVAFSDKQRAHDLDVVFIAWFTATLHVKAVTDLAGNTYTQAFPESTNGTIKLVAYYAADILDGSNSITVEFDGQTAFPDIRVVEYAGLATTNPLDVVAHDTGNSLSSDSGAVATSQPGELVVAGNVVTSSVTKQPGVGFTERLLSQPNGHIVEDAILASPGSLHATAPLQASSPWIMAALAFKPATP